MFCSVTPWMQIRLAREPWKLETIRWWKLQRIHDPSSPQPFVQWHSTFRNRVSSDRVANVSARILGSSTSFPSMIQLRQSRLSRPRGVPSEPRLADSCPELSAHSSLHPTRQSRIPSPWPPSLTARLGQRSDTPQQNNNSNKSINWSITSRNINISYIINL